MVPEEDTGKPSNCQTNETRTAERFFGTSLLRAETFTGVLARMLWPSSGQRVTPH